MNRIFISTLLFCFTSLAFCQSIEVDKVDEFTGKRIIHTSWEKVVWDYAGRMAYFRITVIDSSVIFDYKYNAYSIFALTEGAKMMFMFDNKRIDTLYCIRSMISEKGKGSIALFGSDLKGVSSNWMGLEKLYGVFETNNLIKIRFYTTSGYFEDEIKPKFAPKFKKAIKLILQATTKQ